MIAWKVDPTLRDLVFSGGNPTLIEGVDKLEQDIRWAIVEPLGNDQYNPQWGSRVPFLIGEAFDPQSLNSVVQAETVDTIQRYHAQILETLETFRFSGIPGQFKMALLYATGELIRDIGAIKVFQTDGDERSAQFEIDVTTELGKRLTLQVQLPTAVTISAAGTV